MIFETDKFFYFYCTGICSKAVSVQKVMEIHRDVSKVSSI